MWSKFFAIALLLACAFSTGGTPQRTGKAEGKTDWKVDVSFGFPIRIVSNSVSSAYSVGQRSLLIFLEAQYFTADNIRKLFTGLSARYEQPYDLWITAFSDKAMIQRAIGLGKSEVSIDWANTPEGRAAEKKHAEEYKPLPSGYYRAKYHRISRNNYGQKYLEEEYSYSPDPAKEEMVTVRLREKPPPPYSGNLNADLIIAAEEGDDGKVNSLLKQGANVNARDKDNNTALFRAVLSGRSLETVKVLLDAGADVNARNSDDGYTALQAASSDGETETVKSLLERGAEANPKNDHGDSALILACGNGKTETVVVLLRSGADIEAKDRDGNTSLMNAATGGHTEVVRELLEHGARVDERNDKGSTALMLAKDQDSLLALLKYGANVNAKDNEGNTALMYELYGYRIENMQVLLSAGADVTIKNNAGETVIMMARKAIPVTGRIVKLLKQAEANQRR